MEVCPIDADFILRHGRVLPADVGPRRPLGFFSKLDPISVAEFYSSFVKVPPESALTAEPINTQK